MKRKLDVPHSSDSKGESSQKRPRLTKTLPELLLEVSNGMFEDFHYYLQEQKEIDCDELDLSYCFDNDDPEYRPEYRDVNFYNLAQALKCTHIKSVSLDGNVLGSDKIVEFVKGLKDTEVTSIELAGNNIDDQGLAKLGEALKYTMVTDIDLSRNHIGNLGVAKFGENLKHTKIQKLNLSTNGIESSGAKALGEGLQESMVTSVDISCNYICSDGALMLIAALKDTKVTHLDLHATNITDILAIGNALQRTRITELNLSRNKIESDIIAFGEILKDKKITKLSLAHTHLNSEAAIAIVENFIRNRYYDVQIIRAALPLIREAFLDLSEDLQSEIRDYWKYLVNGDYSEGNYSKNYLRVNAIDGVSSDWTVMKEKIDVMALKSPEHNVLSDEFKKCLEEMIEVLGVLPDDPMDCSL